MKTRYLSLSFLVLLSTVYSAVSKADAPPTATLNHSVTHITSITHRFPNGIAVTPLKQEPSEIADILGIVSWKFDVQNEKPNTDLAGMLEIRERGKPNRELCQFRISLHKLDKTGHCTLWIGLLPIENDMSGSDNLKFLVRANGLVNWPMRMENPFKATYEFGTEVARLQKDGPSELMLVHAVLPNSDPKSTQESRRVDLILNLRTEPHRGNVMTATEDPPPSVDKQNAVPAAE